LQGKDVQEKPRSLLQEATTIDPALAKRLDEINRWVKDLKPGKLTTKRAVMAFLLEVITDATLWLILKAQLLEEQRVALLQLSPPQRYWYSELFPRWLEENDPKFYLWRQKLMAGAFSAADEKVIQAVAKAVNQQEGEFWRRYIADLSMATDLIVSHRQQQSLSTQITSLSDEYSQQKYADWKTTLQSWRIERGLFISYNPGMPDYIQQLALLALGSSDTLESGNYQKVS
jgi:FAD/FMN-containing dehydrogenase